MSDVYDASTLALDAPVEPVVPEDQRAKVSGARCSECPLQNYPMVPSHGPDTADIVVCGEGPGEQELKAMRPFIGKSGQLLTKILRQVGVERDDVFITNAVLCGNGHSTPNRKALMACRGRLVREINERGPSKIISLGGPAAQSVLDTRDTISKLRVGGAKQHGDFPGAAVVATWHPAFALRSPDALPSIIEDLTQGLRIQLGWEPTRYRVETSVESALDSLATQLKSSNELALDIENDPPYNPATPHWLCIGISHRPGHAVVYDKPVVEHPRFQAFLASALHNRDRSWVFQNGKYDTQYLQGGFASNARIDEDTMLAHYACDERKGTHDLEQLSTKYLGAPNYKTEARSYKKDDEPMSMLPPDILHRYNATDVDCTLRLMEPLRKEMASDDVERVYRDLLVPGSNVLARVERHGIRVDLAHLDRLEATFGKREEEIGAEITATWGINPRSFKQILERFSEVGYDLDSSRKEVLQEVLAIPGIKDSDAPRLAGAILEYRSVHKLLSTYVRGNRKRIIDGRIHPNYKLHGTETGRLSSSQPNIQNQVREHGIRDIFIADEGHVLLAGDYSGIEYRLAAIFANDPWPKKAFIQGRNLHDDAAREYYGEKYKGKTKDHERYVTVKTINFGLLYGETAGHLAKREHIPLRDAKGLVALFDRRHPGIRRWQKELANEILARQVLTSYFGRKRRFWLITDENRYDILKEGYNFPLQSTASDLTLRALIKLAPMLEGVATPIITVHDSLVWQTAPEHLQDVARTVRDVMEDTPFDVPTPVELTTGTAWGSMSEMEVV